MQSHREIERTYQPAADQPVPDLSRLPGVATVGSGHSFELVATYFDTADLALTRAGVSIRRRTGGDDEGWHLKLPAGAGRDEIRLPLSRSRHSVPAALRRIVPAWTRGTDLAAVATITTSRTTYALLDSTSAVLAEFSDDHVSANTGGPEGAQAWREWELELVAAGPELLAAADKHLGKAGVTPSELPIKIARALGDRLPAPVEKPKIGRGRPADRVLQLRLTEQVAELLRRDSQIRRGLPEGVHQARVTCRRLRGVLATFRPLFDPAVIDPLRAELQWLQRALGDARDAHVMRERLRTMVDEEPIVVGPVRRRIDRTYRARAREAESRATQALASERYFALLAGLDTLVATPPWTERAQEPANVVLRRRVRREWKRVSRRVEALRSDHDAHEHSLHQVRKSAKQLRYALETVEPVWGKEIRPMHRTAKEITQILGELQDTVVVREHLLELADAATAADESALAYGRLHRRAQETAEQQERLFDQLWESTSPKKLLRRLS